jgi:2-polyprenyl-3-methyl-5-hydroxy-6-metoxy-1,4-benzoquinol methylase
MEKTINNGVMANNGRSSLNADVLNQLLAKMLNDLGAAMSGALVVLGDELGIYTELAESGPVTSHQLAAKTGLHERQLREWLSAQAASGYVTYEAEKETFSLSPEQAAVFADPSSTAAMTGGFYAVSSVYHDEQLVAESFRTGKGLPWGRHNSCLFCGTERFFRPGYEANICQNWIPALEGVQQRLSSGTTVADVGCGQGVSTIIMARSFPNSKFIGFDSHEASIEAAKAHAKEEGVGNVQFAVASAKDFPGANYGFVTVFDALHDMGDPVGASTHIRQVIDPKGTFMIVEPMAGDSLTENLNPVGRMYYSASTMICTPASLSQEVGLALGAQAGERRLKEVLSAGGFTRIRRAEETPFNMILEARP